MFSIHQLDWDVTEYFAYARLLRAVFFLYLTSASLFCNTVVVASRSEFRGFTAIGEALGSQRQLASRMV